MLLMMNHFEAVKEYIMAFEYWPHAALLFGGILLIRTVQALCRMLRTRRFQVKDGRRNLIVIESRSHKKRKKDDINAQYFQYIKSGQYSSGEEESEKDERTGINLIK